MSSPPVEDLPPPVAPPRRRWPRRLILGAIVLVALVAGLYALFDYLQERDLHEAVAEADRLDPGWRFEDLQKARAEVPDDENAAPVVLAARAQMPARWLTGPPPPGRERLEDALADRAPPERLDDETRKDLGAELKRVAAALDTARGLADRPRGRYAVAWTKDHVGTLMPHLEQVRDVIRMLVLDAARRSAEGDGEGALRSCRAALNAARSVGDEPAMVSFLTRIAGTGQAVRALERALAQPEAPAAALEELQRLLAGEAEEPLQLRAARAERIGYYECLEVMRAGKFDRKSYGLATSFLGATGDDLLDRGKARGCEAAFLHYCNELVEIAKLPTQEQPERLKALRAPTHQLPTLLQGLMQGGSTDWPRYAQSFHRAKAELRCAEAALAAERYRLAEGRWPDDLAALVPRYVAAVPADPFDGQPLRLRRLPDGLVVYSVGPDRTDDGGNLDRKRPTAPGTDIGFQLWDVSRRGAAPAPK